MSIAGNIGGFFKDGENGSNGPTKNIKKKIIFLIAAVALGTLLIMVGSGGEGAGIESPAPEVSTGANAGDNSKLSLQEKELAQRLQAILENIDGAGRIQVSVRLATSIREQHAINTTTGSKTIQEKDQSGGSRETIENTDTNQLVLVRNSAGETAVVEMEQSPEVAGVLVVADGANNSQVKLRIYNAVQIALGVAPHKISVMPGTGGVQNAAGN